MHCRWYPSMPCRSPGLHPRGKLRGLAWGGLQAHTQEGLQAHTWGISRPTLGGYPSMHWGRHPPADGYCCRWYASSWNAFLFSNWFSLIKLNIKEWKNSTCWLALVVIVKLWFSVLLNLKSHIITDPKVTNNHVPLKVPKMHSKMGIKPQNIPQTSG